MPSKVVVINRKALKKKYTTKLSRIDDAIKSHIAADAKRGIATSVVDLSSAAEMQGVNGAAVTSAADCKQNKQAIDAVYRASRPDYLLLLGSIDVIPHQDMKNPVYDGVYDLDEHAYGDLPYACEAPYSTNPATFVGPTRVVGRLPDVTKGKNPDYLVKLLKSASSWKSKPAAAAKSYFAVSADEWRVSSELSVKKLFGNAKSLRLSPSDGYKWIPGELKAIPHFINCHGAPSDMHFYGQRDKDYPVAHQAQYLKNRIADGTVAAAECCYGADLYDPGRAKPKYASICNTYLENGAYGFFGSTTIAYGPADSNGAADLICQSFLKEVALGASLGRAALEARQTFVKTESMTDGINLKTLAQFHLLGDPSIHPIEVAKAAGFATAPKAKISVANANVAKVFAAKAFSDGVDGRRRKLFADGLSLAAHTPVAHRKAAPQDARDQLKQVATSMGLTQTKMMTFERSGKTAQPSAAVAKFAAKSGIAFAAPPPGMVSADAPERVHVMLGHSSESPSARAKPAKTKAAKSLTKKAESAKPKAIADFVAVVADEVGGKLTNIRKLHPKVDNESGV